MCLLLILLAVVYAEAKDCSQMSGIQKTQCENENRLEEFKKENESNGLQGWHVAVLVIGGSVVHFFIIRKLKQQFCKPIQAARAAQMQMVQDQRRQQQQQILASAAAGGASTYC